LECVVLAHGSSWTEGLQYKVAAFSLFWCAVHCMAAKLGRKFPRTAFGKILGKRPAHVAHWIYSLACCAAMLGMWSKWLALSWLYAFLIPFAVSFYVLDIVVFCAPTKSWILILHHLAMIIGPTLTVGAGAACLGNGDSHTARKLALASFAAELWRPCLNLRWLLLQNKSAGDARLFAANNATLIALWFWGSIYSFYWLLTAKILPLRNEYKDADSLDTWWGQLIYFGAMLLSRGACCAAV